MVRLVARVVDPVPPELLAKEMQVDQMPAAMAAEAAQAQLVVAHLAIPAVMAVQDCNILNLPY
jgi:hypothetical protein